MTKAIENDHKLSYRIVSFFDKLKNMPTTLVKNILWYFNNLFHCKGIIKDQDLILKIADYVSIFLFSDNEGVKTDAIWIYSQITDIDDNNFLFKMLDVCPIIVNKLSEFILTNKNLAVPCLRTIGNFLTGDD